jgi:hypothetical protein
MEKLTILGFAHFWTAISVSAWVACLNHWHSLPGPWLLQPNIPDARFGSFSAFRRTLALAMDTAGVLLAILHHFICGFSPDHKVAICLKVPAAQLFVFL